MLSSPHQGNHQKTAAQAEGQSRSLGLFKKESKRCKRPNCKSPFPIGMLQQTNRAIESQTCQQSAVPAVQNQKEIRQGRHSHQPCHAKSTATRATSASQTVI